MADKLAKIVSAQTRNATHYFCNAIVLFTEKVFYRESFLEHSTSQNSRQFLSSHLLPRQVFQDYAGNTLTDFPTLKWLPSLYICGISASFCDIQRISVRFWEKLASLHNAVREHIFFVRTFCWEGVFYTGGMGVGFSLITKQAWFPHSAYAKYLLICWVKQWLVAQNVSENGPTLSVYQRNVGLTPKTLK